MPAYAAAGSRVISMAPDFIPGTRSAATGRMNLSAIARITTSAVAAASAGDVGVSPRAFSFSTPAASGSTHRTLYRPFSRRRLHARVPMLPAAPQMATFSMSSLPFSILDPPPHGLDAATRPRGLLAGGRRQVRLRGCPELENGARVAPERLEAAQQPG